MLFHNTIQSHSVHKFIYCSKNDRASMNSWSHFWTEVILYQSETSNLRKQKSRQYTFWGGLKAQTIIFTQNKAFRIPLCQQSFQTTTTYATSFCLSSSRNNNASKALHTICGNNTSIVSSSWWWAYGCPKHVQQIISAIMHTLYFLHWHYNKISTSIYRFCTLLQSKSCTVTTYQVLLASAL